MNAPFPDLSAPAWSPRLAVLLERASAAIARLDARISVSPVAAAWRLRASWSGYARALRLQGVEIDEIDIFGCQCGVPLPHRAPRVTMLEDFAALDSWQAAARRPDRRHWREALPFTFDPPEDWDERPALLRALEVAARLSRADRALSAWLELPFLIRRMRLTREMLPGLVVGDKAWRLAPRDHKAITPRFLKHVAEAAEDGMTQLDALEADRRRAAAALDRERRPGALLPLAARLQHMPVTSPLAAASMFGLSISGAGKLLTRAATLGLVTEISDRRSWRIYLTPDLAVRFGYLQPRRGRPPSPPDRDDVTLDSLLARFDAEVAAFDATVQRHGMATRSEERR